MCFQVAGVTTFQGYGDGDIGVIDDRLLGLYLDCWGYPYVGVLPVTGLKV